MHRIASRLLLYASPREDSIVNTLSRLSEQVPAKPSSWQRPSYDWVLAYRLQARRILAFDQAYRVSGNLWQAYLTFLLVTDDNPFTRACAEGLRDSALREIALKEAPAWMDLFHFDFSPLDTWAGAPFFASLRDDWDNDGRSEGNEAGEKLVFLRERLNSAGDSGTFMALLAEFIENNGCGLSSIHSAFRLAPGPDFRLEPAERSPEITLDTLIGYEKQKAQMTDNVTAFLRGLPCNHMLLYGDAGTGKSTSVKALLNLYVRDGLRLVEVRKQQLDRLEQVLRACRQRTNRYLIYIDDLSFEENETGYKHLKAVIEGGISDLPRNVMLVATSNRRHLVREDWRDRSDMEHVGDVHRSDTLEEKLSLASRFGCAVSFSIPSVKEYHRIVAALYSRAGGSALSEEALFRQADAWEIRHGGANGRAARQFVRTLIAREQARPDGKINSNS